MSDPRSGPVLHASLMPHAPILVPSVAGGRLGRVQLTIAAMREAARRAIATRPDAIVLISPHSPRFQEGFGIWEGERLSGTLARFGAPHEAIDFPLDVPLADEIVRHARQCGLRTERIAGKALDHGAVVPFWFIAEAGWDGPVVVLALNAAGGSQAVRFGQAVAEAAASAAKQIVFVSSGDMSHRLTEEAPCGFDPRGAEFDRWLIGNLRRGAHRELLEASPENRHAAGEDALDSILVGLGATRFDATGSEVLSYEGPFGVGYGVAVLYHSPISTNHV